MYLALSQRPVRGLSYFVTTLDEPAARAEEIRSTVWEVDPHQPVEDLRSLEQMVSDLYAGVRLSQGMLSAFGILAVILAASGIYSVLSYSIARRQRDMAIRMAFGAARSALLRRVLLSGIRPALIGIVFGLVSSALITRAFAAVLYDVGPTDLLTYGATALFLFGVSVVASYLPALRAVNVGPARALRQE